MINLVIDEEFSSLLNPLSDNEFATLRQLIIKDGKIHDRIKVWGSLIIDGEHRYKIALENNIPFEVEEMDFEDRDEARKWICMNQLGRRNLDGITRASLVGRVRESKTVNQIASETGKSPRTVRRDVVAAKAVEKLPKPVRDKIATGKVEYSSAALNELEKLPEDQKQVAIEVLQNSKVESIKDAVAVAKAKPEDHRKNPKIARGEQTVEEAVGRLLRAIDEREGILQDEALGYSEKCRGFVSEFNRVWKEWMSEY
jgi:ParB-like chromosome segregation protein Spo0J